MTFFLRILSLLAVLITLSVPARAEIYSYITKSVWIDSNDIDYTYTIAAWSPPPRGTPHPCTEAGISGKTCYVNVNHRHNNNNEGGNGSRNDVTFNQRCRGTNLYTLPDATAVYNFVYNNCFGGLPYHGIAQHHGSSPIRNECVTLFLTSSPDKNRGKMFPGAICGVAPPPGGICSFTTASSQVVLDHGRVPDNAIDGNEASQSISMKCSKNTSVRVFAITTTDRRILLKQNLYTTLKLNGQSLSSIDNGSMIYVPAERETYATLSSVLSTTGAVTPGGFGGMISVIMTID